MGRDPDYNILFHQQPKTLDWYLNTDKSKLGRLIKEHFLTREEKTQIEIDTPKLLKLHEELMNLQYQPEINKSSGRTGTSVIQGINTDLEGDSQIIGICNRINEKELYYFSYMHTLINRVISDNFVTITKEEIIKDCTEVIDNLHFAEWFIKTDGIQNKKEKDKINLFNSYINFVVGVHLLLIASFDENEANNKVLYIQNHAEASYYDFKKSLPTIKPKKKYSAKLPGGELLLKQNWISYKFGDNEVKGVSVNEDGSVKKLKSAIVSFTTTGLEKIDEKKLFNPYCRMVLKVVAMLYEQQKDNNNKAEITVAQINNFIHGNKESKLSIETESRIVDAMKTGMYTGCRISFVGKHNELIPYNETNTIYAAIEFRNVNGQAAVPTYILKEAPSLAKFAIDNGFLREFNVSYLDMPINNSENISVLAFELLEKVLYIRDQVKEVKKKIEKETYRNYKDERKNAIKIEQAKMKEQFLFIYLKDLYEIFGNPGPTEKARIRKYISIILEDWKSKELIYDFVLSYDTTRAKNKEYTSIRISFDKYEDEQLYIAYP